MIDNSQKSNPVKYGSKFKLRCLIHLFPVLLSAICKNLRRGVRSDVQLSCTKTHFKSALRVVKMVLNTQCNQYLTMQKIKRNTKKIKIADFTM